MARTKTLDETYHSCMGKEHIIFLNEADQERALTLMLNAVKDIESLKEITPLLERGKNHGLAWCLRYETIRQLVEGILLMEQVQSENHQCLFAYLCANHPDWGIEWDTIEGMRQVRNRVHYDGLSVKEDTWIENKPLFELYTMTLIRILREKLESCH
jgi:hypothetical protein